LRHGPFKAPTGLQLHALLHTEETFRTVPMITRWVWNLTEFGAVLPNSLFSQHPTYPILRESCLGEIISLRTQLRTKTIQFKEWSRLQSPTLLQQFEPILSDSEHRSALRYFVLAAAADTAAVWDRSPKDYSWFLSCCSSNVVETLNRLHENRSLAPTVAVAHECLDEFQHCLAAVVTNR
jgi:hypothetical protein